MLLFLLIVLNHVKAISWNSREKEAVYLLSKSATKAVYADIGRKANQIYTKFETFMHPLQKRELNKNSSLIKQAIKKHLYQQFGAPVIQKIPYIIKDSIEQASYDIDLNMENIPTEYQFTNQQAQKFAYQMSSEMARKTQSNLEIVISSKWDAFEKENRDKASREHRLPIDGHSLEKRDFLDKVRQKYKFFQIDPTKKWWVRFTNA